MVEGEREYVVVVGDADQLGAQGGAGGEVERGGGVGGDELGGVGGGVRVGGEVGEGKVDCGGGVYDLGGQAVGGDEPGAQYLVAVGDLGECVGEGVVVQVAGEVQRCGDVVFGAFWFELVQEP